MEYQQFKQQWEQKWGKSELGAIKALLIGVIEYLEDEDKGNKMIALTLLKIISSMTELRVEMLFWNISRKIRAIAPNLIWGGYP